MPDNNVAPESLPFTDEKSFGLFMEGLRSLQQYEDEAAKHSPVKASLERTMHSALTCFRDAASRYPDDLLSVFYLAVALSMKNQEVYVDRLAELKDELMAFGRSLAFEDEANVLSTAPAGETHQTTREKKKSFAAARAAEEKALAQAFLDLGGRPWPLLEAASRLFEGLSDKPAPPELLRVVRYNWAQVLARRGSKDEQSHLTEALKVASQSALPVVADLEAQAETLKARYDALSQAKTLKQKYSALNLPPQTILGRFSPSLRNARKDELDLLRRKIHSVYEAIALVFQFDALRESLNLRIAAFQTIANFPTAAAAAQSVENSIEKTSLFDPGFKADLLADYLTKIGYAKYEAASNRELHKAAPGNPAIAQAMGLLDATKPSAGFFIDKAAQDFTFALELKEHWNPAQIYLALVRRVQAGMAAARTELLQYPLLENADSEAELASIREERGRTGANDTAKLLELTNKEVEQLNRKKEIEASLKTTYRGLDRLIAASDRERQRYAREADELFAVLQGLPLSSPSSPGTVSAPGATMSSSATPALTPLL